MTMACLTHLPDYSEALQMLDKPHTSFKAMKYRKHIALSPKYTDCILKGIREILTTELAVYSETVKGIPIAFNKPKCVEKYGSIMDENPYMHFHVEVECVVFQPHTGDRLLGRVNKLADDHFGCLVHGQFNVSIHRPRDIAAGASSSSKNWVGSMVSGGEEVMFEVTGLNTRGVVSMYGQITEECEGKIKENYRRTQKKRKRESSLGDLPPFSTGAAMEDSGVDMSSPEMDANIAKRNFTNDRHSNDAAVKDSGVKDSPKKEKKRKKEGGEGLSGSGGVLQSDNNEVNRHKKRKTESVDSSTGDIVVGVNTNICSTVGNNGNNSSSMENVISKVEPNQIGSSLIIKKSKKHKKQKKEKHMKTEPGTVSDVVLSTNDTGSFQSKTPTGGGLEKAGDFNSLAVSNEILTNPAIDVKGLVEFTQLKHKKKHKKHKRDIKPEDNVNVSSKSNNVQEINTSADRSGFASENANIFVNLLPSEDSVTKKKHKKQKKDKRIKTEGGTEVSVSSTSDVASALEVSSVVKTEIIDSINNADTSHTSTILDSSSKKVKKHHRKKSKSDLDGSLNTSIKK